MKNLKRIDEAVGSILERRASADRLLKDVVKGNASEVEGIKLSKEMADAFLMWLKGSTYGKKFGALPFYKLFSAAPNWGLERYIGKDKKIKDEFKELKAKAKEMSKAEMKGESLDEKRSSPFGEIMLDIDAASKQVKLPMRWLKDYVKSIERMAKRSAKKFFKDYGTFTVDDWAEDMEYNFANESKVNEAKFSFSEDQVKDVAELIAKAIAKMDKAKTAVHDMEYDAGRGAGFEISMDGEKYDGGSYTVRPNGEVYNAAIGNSFPNAIYAKIGDKDINKIIKNIKKFESVTEARFVKSYDTKVNDAETEKDVLKIYPKAQFFVGKMSHFFGELEPNLFFKAYYPKYYKQDTGKSVKGDFKITSVYSKKGSNYVELMESFESYAKFVSENYDTEQRKEMAAKGFALADGSFPIANLEDLKNAIMAYGRAKDQAKAAKFIAKRAKALGAEDLIPDSDDFQQSLKEGIEDVYTQVPAKTIAIEEGKDIGSWNQGGLKGDKNVLITTFVGPKDIEDFGLGRKCMQINVGMDYISLNPADIVELKDILKSYKVK
jgi:hypothetical protein